MMYPFENRLMLYWLRIGLFATILSLPHADAICQINAYAKVSTINGTLLTLSNVNQVYASFNVGDKVIVMQMQDNVIGNNTSNNTSFGTITTIGYAGRYEVAKISSVAGMPGSITLASNLINTYNCSTGSVQLISFPKLGAPDYTTTAAVNALPWDGFIGGVVAMQVPGVLTVANPITADNAGFRGGTVSTNYEVNCEPGVYASSLTQYGYKGEGVQYNQTPNISGRSSIANGGGRRK